MGKLVRLRGECDVTGGELITYPPKCHEVVSGGASGRNVKEPVLWRLGSSAWDGVLGSRLTVGNKARRGEKSAFVRYGLK